MKLKGVRKKLFRRRSTCSCSTSTLVCCLFFGARLGIDASINTRLMSPIVMTKSHMLGLCGLIQSVNDHTEKNGIR